MEPSCSPLWSTGYQGFNSNQGHPRTVQKNANSAEIEPNLSNPFLNNNQMSINNRGLPFQNRSTSILDNGVDLTYEQQFHKQENRLQYTELAQDKQTISEDMSAHNFQSNLPVNMSLAPHFRNSEPFNQTTYLDKSQINQHNKSAQEYNPHQRISSINSLAYLQPDMAANPSGHQSLNFDQTCFNSTSSTSRNTSLDSVNTGIFGRGSFEYDVMLGQFQGHRRSPSEYSDVSVASLQHSPSLSHQNFFDQQNSPIHIAHDPASYQDVLAIDNFSLSDPQIPSPHSKRSPSHSPAISPRLNPQQLNREISHSDGVIESYFPQEQFPSLQNEKVQAQLMIPPEINVEFVSMSKQNMFEMSRPNLIDRNALTPTDKGRRRAFTDTISSNSNVISRPRNTSCSSSFGTNLSNYSPSDFCSLSPNSESTTPNRLRRRSTPATPNQDHSLKLADSVYQPAVLERTKIERAQKHPATYQCSICPKKFTRAYNLRSHLRTHTNERPYICSKCKKAFARQHDKKRHESLHSGEKKFICSGKLKSGGQWGCGRPFARADALHRHFRSEAGRVCINPVIQEEQAKGQRIWDENQIQNMQQSQPQIAISGNIDVVPNQFTLPAALLAQYPALACYNWTDLSQGEGGIEDDVSGRSSFDASGSEYFE